MRWTVLLVLALSVHAKPSKETMRAIRAATKQLRSKKLEVRRSGARELSRYGPACLVVMPKLVKALGDDDWAVRSFISRIVVSIGARAMPGLIKGLRSRDVNVRLGIGAVLLEKKLLPETRPHLDALGALFEDKDARVRDYGVRLFAASGAPAVGPLLSTLKSSKEPTRNAAATALVTAGATVVPRLGAALTSERNARVREGICRALEGMGKKAAPASEALAAAVRNDGADEVRAAAARAIGRTGTGFDSVGDALFAGLAAESDVLREGCVAGLALFGSASAPGLVDRLGAKNRREQDGAVEALCRMGAPAVGPLRVALRDEPASRRLAALDVFVRLRWFPKRADVLVAMQGCLKHGSAAVRIAAARALGRLGRHEGLRHRSARSTDVREVLFDAAKDPDAAVRAAALIGLGRLAASGAEKTFAAARKDKDATVRLAANYGKWTTDGDVSAALKELLAALAEPGTRAAAAELLGYMASAAEPAVAELVALLEDKQPTVRRAAARALGSIVRPGRADLRALRGSWKNRAPAPVRKAIESGLRWLENNQEESGAWDARKHKGGALYDVGVTALALWAHLGAGDTDTPVVRSGLDYLLKTQDIDGVIGTRRSHSFMSYHAFATIALAEAWLLTGHPRYARPVQHAIDYDEYARNPRFAWRYEPRGGESDTHITAEVLTAVRLGDLAGADVDPDTYAGAARWIEHMTEPNFGQIGYNYPGGTPARPEGKQDTYPAEESQAMTAAGIWCRQLLGGAALESGTVPPSIGLCMDVPPTWSRGGRDLFYHQFGSLAVHQHDGKEWPKWQKTLHSVYLATQETDGSWAPTGVWGSDGGRVYSTAMATLSLLTPYRYPPGFASDPKPKSHETAAIRALRTASKDENAGVAAAARRALERIGPRE